MRIALGVLTPDAGEVRWRASPSTRASADASATCPRNEVSTRRCACSTSSSTSRGCTGVGAPTLGAGPRRRSRCSGSPDRAGDRVEALSLGNQQRVQLAAGARARPRSARARRAVLGPRPGRRRRALGGAAAPGVEPRRTGRVLEPSARSRRAALRRGRADRPTDASWRTARSTSCGPGGSGDASSCRSRHARRRVARVDPRRRARGVDGRRRRARARRRAVDEQRVLDLARASGDVVRFGPVHPTSGGAVPRGGGRMTELDRAPAPTDRGAWRLVAARDFSVRLRDKGFVDLDRDHAQPCSRSSSCCGAFGGDDTPSFDLGAHRRRRRGDRRRARARRPSGGGSSSPPARGTTRRRPRKRCATAASTPCCWTTGCCSATSGVPPPLTQIVQDAVARSTIRGGLDEAGVPPDEIDALLDRRRSRCARSSRMIPNRDAERRHRVHRRAARLRAALRLRRVGRDRRDRGEGLAGRRDPALDDPAAAAARGQDRRHRPARHRAARRLSRRSRSCSSLAHRRARASGRRGRHRARRAGVVRRWGSRSTPACSRSRARSSPAWRSCRTRWCRST